MKRIFIPMGVVCILVAALLAQPKAEEENTAATAPPPAGSKQSLDQGFQAALLGTLPCCEIAADANDDGVLNPYDFLFAFSYGIQYAVPLLRVYSEGFCFDQMISDPLVFPPGYNPVLNHAKNEIRPHLFFDQNVTLICGSKGY